MSLTIQDKVQECRKQGYIVDVAIDMKMKYKANKLQLIIKKNNRQVKKLPDRYSNKTFGSKVNEVYAKIYDKITKPKNVY